MNFSYFPNPYWNSGDDVAIPPRFGGFGSDHETTSTRKIVQRIIEKVKRVEIGLIPESEVMSDPDMQILLDSAYKSISSPVIRSLMTQEDDEEVMLLVLAGQPLE